MRRVLIGAAFGATLLPALWHLVTLITVLSARLRFPQDIEWMEGSHLYHAYRLAHGLPIYIDPARGFATFPYPPLYWIVVALIGRLFGLDYWTGRLVSVASLFGSLIILGAVLLRRAPTRWLGVLFALVGAASVGASYPSAYGSFDLARSDALATFLPIGAAALAGDGRISRTRALLTAGAATAAIWTKQTGIFFAAWIGAFVFVRCASRGRLVLGATAAACAVLFALACAITDGWFAVWLFDMRHHAIAWSTWADPAFVFVHANPLLVTVPPLAFALQRRGWLSAEAAKWIGVLAAAVVGTMLAHVKVGGWVNLYIPVLVLSWPVTLLLFCDLLRGLWPGRAGLTVGWLTLAAAATTFTLRRYDPAPYIPTQKMWAAAHRFHEAIAGFDGEVIVSTKPFAAVRDGKHCEQPIFQGYFDSQNAGMTTTFVDALGLSCARYLIVTSTELEAYLQDALARSYDRVGELDLDLDAPGFFLQARPVLWKRRAP
ncbi:MAG: hypothetical protein ABW133_14780 [Polyangiaceae bacterium]